VDIIELADRDNWECWLCSQPVPRNAKPSDPNAPTKDHVRPRSRGGHGTPDNLRLAHKRCNNLRKSKAPVVLWPPHLTPIDAPPLYNALARLARKPGTSEIVALFATSQDATQAQQWLDARAGLLFEGNWCLSVVPLGQLWSLRATKLR
jgi:hypothetical protein